MEEEGKCAEQSVLWFTPVHCGSGCKPGPVPALPAAWINDERQSTCSPCPVQFQVLGTQPSRSAKRKAILTPKLSLTPEETCPDSGEVLMCFLVGGSGVGEEGGERKEEGKQVCEDPAWDPLLCPDVLRPLLQDQGSLLYQGSQHLRWVHWAPGLFLPWPHWTWRTPSSGIAGNGLPAPPEASTLVWSVPPCFCLPLPSPVLVAAHQTSHTCGAPQCLLVVWVTGFSWGLK